MMLLLKLCLWIVGTSSSDGGGCCGCCCCCCSGRAPWSSVASFAERGCGGGNLAALGAVCGGGRVGYFVAGFCLGIWVGLLDGVFVCLFGGWVAWLLGSGRVEVIVKIVCGVSWVFRAGGGVVWTERGFGGSRVGFDGV